MAQDLKAVKPNCYIEFRVYDAKRFEIMQRFFEPLGRSLRLPVSSLIPGGPPGSGGPTLEACSLLGAQVGLTRPEHFQAPARQLTPSAAGRRSSGQLKGPSRAVRIARLI